MRKQMKNQSNKTLKKIKANNDLKSVEVDLANNLSKIRWKVLLMLKFILMMMMILKNIGLLDLDKMRVSSNKMRHSGLLKTHLKEYFFLGMNIRYSERIPKIPIAAVNIDEVIISEQFPCAKKQKKDSKQFCC